jgi:hypothetical protein
MWLLLVLLQCTLILVAAVGNDGPMGLFWNEQGSFVYRSNNIFQTPGHNGSEYQMNTGFQIVADADPNTWYVGVAFFYFSCFLLFLFLSSLFLTSLRLPLVWGWPITLDNVQSCYPWSVCGTGILCVCTVSSQDVDTC